MKLRRSLSFICSYRLRSSPDGGCRFPPDWPVTEKLDLDAIYKIKEEGLQRSKVMEIESYLTDVYGPRLTNSPNFSEAGRLGAEDDEGVGLRERPPRDVAVRPRLAESTLRRAAR